MTFALVYWQLIAWSLLGFIVSLEAAMKHSLHSLIKAAVLLWNGLLFSLFLFFVWVLCIAFPSRLCTKNVVLSGQGKNPKTFNTIAEEMIGLIVSYVRVSSREQAYNTNALAQQRERTIQAGAQQIFEDIQKGKSDKRPAFQKLLELVKRGRIQKIIITRIDRITRSLRTLKDLIDTLEEHGVILVILDQNIDLSTAQGRLMLNMLGMLAEWEVDLLAERIQHGKNHQRVHQWANGSRPWGYEVVNHQYVLDQTPFLCLLNDRPDDYMELSQLDDLDLLPRRTIAELARDCIDIFFEKKGVRRALKVIFEQYGIVKTGAKFNGTDKIFHWTIHGFALWIINPVLDGHTAYMQSKTVRGKRILLPESEWQVVRDTHPDQRLFEDGEAAVVKFMIHTNRSNGSGAFQKNLTGAVNYRPFAYQNKLVYCDECGSRCTPKSCFKSEYCYYACRHVGIGCTNRKAVRRKNVEESLIEALVEQSHRLNQVGATSEETMPTHSETLVRLESKLAWLEQSPGFDLAVEGLKQQTQKEIEEEKNPFLSADKVFDSSVDDLIRVGNNLAIWHLLNNDEKVEIFGKLVHKIYIRDGKVVSVVFNS
jgi:predicted site-specific integrase-resolvase